MGALDTLDKLVYLINLSTSMLGEFYLIAVFHELHSGIHHVSSYLQP